MDEMVGPVGSDAEMIEHAVLTMVLRLHPEHLTDAELVLKLCGEQARDEDSVQRAILELKGSGLLRRCGCLILPTHAAVRMGELIARHH